MENDVIDRKVPLDDPVRMKLKNFKQVLLE